MPNEPQDRIGLLVVRAFVEEDQPPRLIVRLLEVHPAGGDRVIGIVDSPVAAARLLGQWLEALRSGHAGARLRLRRSGTARPGTHATNPRGRR